eukprot:TRINITY_DN11931_c0_g1_i1.p1 TRINITY_DN11931_c0_g1~~TRINITY_DN11931_c0_g1_i1.p1  ORF type:complete len:115 (-),score=43.14 TRINITY_DN11931_c0_g1_i1:93-437(-)
MLDAVVQVGLMGVEQVMSWMLVSTVYGAVFGAFLIGGTGIMARTMVNMLKEEENGSKGSGVVYGTMDVLLFGVIGALEGAMIPFVCLALLVSSFLIDETPQSDYTSKLDSVQSK